MSFMYSKNFLDDGSGGGTGFKLSLKQSGEGGGNLKIFGDGSGGGVGCPLFY